MKQLGSPSVDAAQQLSPPTPTQLTRVESEVARQMQICNACRYCEGFCAVFPAMTRRLDFFSPDIHYLANLCHNCGACLHACQYAAPHEFGVNVPKAMASVRGETYANYSWPRAMGALYKRNGLFVASTIAACLSLFLLLAVAMTGQLIHDPLAGNFYAVFPHNLMASLFGAVSVFVALSMGIGAFRFWRDIKLQSNSVPATAEAAKNVLGLTYLDGGHGDGCNEEDDRFTLARRRFHHFTFYGFMLCFASTMVGTIYHYFMGQAAPYPILSLPVLLGTVGGMGLLIGPSGLLWLNYRRHLTHGDPKQRPMDRGFILLLLLTSASGLALLVCRDTGAMAILLAIHLGIVLALFLTLPYGKFVHGLYRSIALMKWSIEKRLPNNIGIGAD